MKGDSMSRIEINRIGNIPEAGAAPVSEKEILENSCDRLKITRCILKAGTSWNPEKYAYGKGIQIFVMLNATGYIYTDTQTFNVTEPSIFVPNFDRENFCICAGGKDQEIIRIAGNFSERDSIEIGKSHLMFPRFRLLSAGWEHTTRETIKEGANVRAFVLIENRKLGSYNMGHYMTGSEGVSSDFCDNCLPTYDQWCIGVNNADFTVTVNGETEKVGSGDMAFIPRGSHYSYSSTPEGKLDMIWFMLNRAHDNV